MDSPHATTALHRRLVFPPDDRGGCVLRGLAFTRFALAGWRPDADDASVGDTLLVVAELLANAVDHAGGPLSLDLRLGADAARLRIEVADPVAAEPYLRLVPPTEPHGRGVRIVDRVAEDWGSRPEGRGKTVWAECRLR